MTSYDVKSAFEQIEKCDFECEGGPLTNNTGYTWLKEHIFKGPKFAVNQWVYYCIEGDVSGVPVKHWARMCVVQVSLAHHTNEPEFSYCLSNDPPRPYHYGNPPQIRGVREALLFTEQPS